MEQQKNQNKVTEAFNALAQKHMKEIYKMRKANDQDGLFALQDTLFIQAEAEAAKQPDFHFTPEQIEGMDVVDKIQQVKTASSDRPEEDVKIINVSVIE